MEGDTVCASRIKGQGGFFTLIKRKQQLVGLTVRWGFLNDPTEWVRVVG